MVADSFEYTGSLGLFDDSFWFEFRLIVRIVQELIVEEFFCHTRICFEGDGRLS